MLKRGSPSRFFRGSSVCSRLEGKDCSDESSARTYGDGPRFKNSQRKTPFAIQLSPLQREDSLALLLLGKKS